MIQNLKKDPKQFFSFVRSRQNTKIKVGPFLDPVTGSPNPDPDFAAGTLRKQYVSVFSLPRRQWKISNGRTFQK